MRVVYVTAETGQKSQMEIFWTTNLNNYKKFIMRVINSVEKFINALF